MQVRPVIGVMALLPLGRSGYLTLGRRDSINAGRRTGALGAMTILVDIVKMTALAEQYYGSHHNRKLDIYLIEYERLFGPMRNSPLRLLELGVSDGASMVRLFPKRDDRRARCRRKAVAFSSRQPRSFKEARMTRSLWTDAPRLLVANLISE